MESKRCLGPLHPPGGAILPIENFSINITGPRAGKPLSRCKTCRSSGNPKTVPSEFFMPLVEVLFDGRNIKEVSRIVDLDKNLVRDLMNGKRKRIYKQTYLNLKRGIENLPKQKETIGPSNQKTKRNGLTKLNYEDRIALKNLISEVQKERYKIDKKLLRHVV
jgi:hypothetical protein